MPPGMPSIRCSLDGTDWVVSVSCPPRAVFTNSMRLGALLLPILAAACDQGTPGYVEMVLPGDGVAKQIEVSLEGTSGEFCCDKIDRDGKRIPGCRIQLGPALSSKRFEFSLPD